MVGGLRCQGCDRPLPPSLPRGRPRKWCSTKCFREARYAGRCVNCGTPTSGSNGPGTASEYCVPCGNRARMKWTREACIEAIRRFHAEYGRIPRVQDFSTVNRDRPSRRPPGDWPHYSTLRRVFGGHSAAVRAAGLEPFDQARDHTWSTKHTIYPKQGGGADD